MPLAEPKLGVDPPSLRSRPEVRSRVGRLTDLSHPGAPQYQLLKTNYLIPPFGGFPCVAVAIPGKGRLGDIENPIEPGLWTWVGGSEAGPCPASANTSPTKLPPICP